MRGARGRTFRARFAGGRTRAPAALVNLSTRAYHAGGDETIIAGFVIGGTGPKRLLVRAVGPTLGAFGLGGTLPNPRLTLVNQAGATVAENDDWGASPDAAALAALFPVAGAFALGAGSRDAAVVATLPPGAYSAVVRSTDRAAGVALLELYDLEPGAPARLVNLSTRTFSGPGEQTAIVGFGLAGNAARPVLVRAAGPALAAFALAPASRDAAVLPELPAGTYTAVAAGASAAATGQTLVEVYVVP